MKRWLPWVGGVLIVSLLLTMLEGKGDLLPGWLAYVVMCSLCAGLIVIAWRWLATEDTPGWLAAALGVALFLRLGVGIGLMHALPLYGYGNEQELEGYVFWDAYARDTDAWSLAKSDQPLATAFAESGGSDQYGGLRYLSALVYRYLSSDVHRSFLIGVLSATVSSLSILFIWRFTSMVISSKAAAIAAWIAVIYPEAVLLGSSQMREPFISLAIGMAFYAYAIMRLGYFKRDLIPILLGVVVLLLPISPPYAIAALGAVGAAWLWEGRLTFRRSKWLLLPLILVGVASLILVVNVWSTIGTISSTGISALLEWWISAGGLWQWKMIWMQSAWTRALLMSTPDWSHFPLIVFYGLLRPFLPAALIDSGAPLWHAMAIWRALGWFSLLPFLLYAPIAAIRRTGWRSLPTYLSFLVWVTAILASYRGAGDQWDNPRYRMVFLVAQASLAGWAWINAQQVGGSWLRRIVWLVGITTMLFTIWHKWRAQWLSWVGVIHIIGIIGAFIVLFLIGSIVFDVLKARRVGA